MKNKEIHEQAKKATQMKTISVLWLMVTLVLMLLLMSLYSRMITSAEREQLEQGLTEISSAQARYLNNIIENIAVNGHALRFTLESYADLNHVPFEKLADEPKPH